MRNIVMLSVFMLLFSCNGNGQNTNLLTAKDVLEVAVSNSENQVMFSGGYTDLLTLKLAAQITASDPSKVVIMHSMKGMLTESLRYYWENGRQKIKEKSASNRKAVTSAYPDYVLVKWLDGEADMESFLNFIGLEKHPELTKVDGVGEAAYWNSKNKHLELYYNGVSFTLQVVMSNEDVINKEKTIELAKLIIEKQIN